MTDNTPANDKQSATRIFESSDPALIEQFAKKFRERNRHRRIPVRSLSGSCIVFGRKITDTVGLFDEQFSTDRYAITDFCLRASIEKYRNLIAGDIVVYRHKHIDMVTQNKELFIERRNYFNKWNFSGTDNPDYPKLLTAGVLNESDELYQKGRKDQAVAVILNGLKENPHDERLHYKLVELLIEFNKFREADDVLKSMPGHLKQGLTWLELAGACKASMLEYDKAAQYSEDMLALDATSARALNLKGFVAFSKGNYAEAERFLTKAIESDIGFGEAYGNLGGLKWALKDFEKAYELLERAFILSPASESVALNYHSASVALSRQERASALFREAASLYPLSRRLKYMLADLLLQQERHHEAMDVIEKALLAFGMEDDSLTLASALREKIGPHSKGPRGKGGKGESYDEIATGSALAMTQGKDVIARSTESLRDDVAISFQTERSPLPKHVRDPNDTESGSLSVCMILKDEEKNIGICLHNIKPLADEIIVVDTGSTDRTKEIAKVFGAKVYDFAWTDSFSDARNYSLSKATGDWILVLDADETIAPSDFGKIRELIENGPRIQGVKGSSHSEIATPAPGGFAMTDKKNVIARSPVERGTTRQSHSDKTYVTQSHSLKESQRVSSFKIAFSFITRNYVMPMNTPGWIGNNGEYLDEEAGTGWFSSTKVRLFPNDDRIRFQEPVHEFVELSLINAGIPIMESPVPIHHYGKLNTEKLTPKAHQYYELGKAKYLARGEEDALSLYEIAVQASELHEFKDALVWWEKLVELRPDFSRAYYGLGNTYFRLGRFEDAVQVTRKAIGLAQKLTDWRDAVILFSHAAACAGKAGESIQYIDQLLTSHPDDAIGSMLLATTYLFTGAEEKGLEVLRQLKKKKYDAPEFLGQFAKHLADNGMPSMALVLLNAAVKTNMITKNVPALIEECERKINETHRDSSRHVETTEEGIKDSRGQVSKNKVQGAEELRKDEIATPAVGGNAMTDKEVFARDDKQNESERSPRPDNLRDSQ